MSKQELEQPSILYQDSDCLVINKPAGLIVHSDGRSPGPFLTDWIAQKFPQASDVGEPSRAPDGTEIVRPGIVHRLDRETSGVLIVALNQETHQRLKKQFQDREIVKKYLAFVWGDLVEEFGTITRPIGRNGSDFRKWSAQPGARGIKRTAETYWTRVASVTLDKGEIEQGTEPSLPRTFTLINAEPKTGRTHQIRVHLSAIHHPVVGDTLYAPKRPPALGFQRTALHSWSIAFTNREGKLIKVVAPLPTDFVRACARAGLDGTKIKP